MADDFCKQQLIAWGLDTLVERFRDNGINESIFPELTADLIKELIPQIGLRIQFSLKWGELYAQKKKNEKLVQNSDDSETSSTVSEAKSDNRENVDFNNTDHESTNTLLKKLRRPHVKQMLNNSTHGRAILKSFSSTRKLTRKCRNSIVGIIITEILQDCSSVNSYKNEDFDLLSKEIIQVFPSEEPGTYYVPPIKKQSSRTKVSIGSRGKLVDKYRNKLREYKKLTGCSYSSDSSSSSTSVDPSVDPSSSDELAEVDIETQNSVRWLEKNQAPWELVLSHWTVTHQYRRKKIRQADWNKVADILKEWPILLHPTGHELVNRDYELLKLTEIANDIVNWQSFFDTLHDLSRMKEAKKSNDLYDLLNSDDLNEDSRVAVQLLLLPHFVPPKGRMRIGAKHWKPTITECAESLIEHAKVPGDVSRIQSKKVGAMNELKLTVQPYIIVVGPTLKEISAVYVCIDQTLYNVGSTLSAIDICFKAYHVFNAAYPPQSEHIWYLLQHGLYQITTKYDKQIAYILDLTKILRDRSATVTASK